MDDGEDQRTQSMEGYRLKWTVVIFNRLKLNQLESEEKQTSEMDGCNERFYLVFRSTNSDKRVRPQTEHESYQPFEME